MMLDTNDLVVHLKSETGALQRLLNTLRRRGFAVDSLEAHRLEDNGYRVEVRVDNLQGGSRSVEALAKHIDNLVDVRSVSVLGPALSNRICMDVELKSQYDADLEARLSRALETVYEVDGETPLEPFPMRAGWQIYLKREDRSKVRSYKWRGAYHKISQCVAAGDRGPFVATSAGNHAQGVALAAHALGVHATIFMPKTTPQLKREAVANLGADGVDIQLVGDGYDDAAAAAEEWRAENRATHIAPFDDLDVIAGQATVGVELQRQASDADFVFVPIGGGGLAAGVSFVMRHANTRVVGVEATGQDSMRTSLEVGRPHSLSQVDRFCDGTGVKRPGTISFELCRHHLDGMITVSNEQVCQAIEACWNRRRLIPEPSGALAIAGLMQAEAQGLVKPDSDRCVAIVTGANTDFLNLPTIVRGSHMNRTTKRFFRFTIAERNGSLIDLLDTLLAPFNIVDFQYGKTDATVAKPVMGLSGAPAQFEKMLSEAPDALAVEEVTQREFVVFRVIPFRADILSQPLFLHIDFPERPGALSALMRRISGFAGICYFNYAESGTQEGQALLGFECDDRERLLNMLETLRFPFHETEMESLLG